MLTYLLFVSSRDEKDGAGFVEQLPGLEMIAGEGFREDAGLHRLDYSHL